VCTNAELIKVLDDPKSTRDFRVIFGRELVVRESISKLVLETVDA